MNAKLSMKRRVYRITMRTLMVAATALTCSLMLFLIGYVLIKGVPHLSWELISTKPSYISERIGILPDILNTLYLVFRMSGRIPILSEI